MNEKYIIFDLGGVVLEDGTKQVFHKLKRETGEDTEEIEKAFRDTKRKGGISDLEIGKISPKRFFTNFYKEVTLGVEGEEFEKWLLHGFIPIHEVWDIINSLHGKVDLVLLTNHNKEWMRMWKRKYKIFKKFKYIFNSADIGLRKPMPQIFEYVMKKLKAKGGQCFFVDDTPENISTAKKFGMDTFVFYGGISSEKLLTKIKSFLTRKRVN